MSKLSVVVGGQYGSEGKGAITAYLADAKQNIGHSVIAVRVAGPNAGHTVIGRCPPGCVEMEAMNEAAGERASHGMDRHPWRLRQVPVAAVSNPDAQLMIGAGSEIEAEVLRSEIDELDAAGYGASARLVVDNMATIIEEEHKHAEEDLARDGRSTGKGIGAARMARVMREAYTVRQMPTGFVPGDRIDTARYLQSMLRDPHAHILIEGTQGYGLGLHTQFYPYTTSSDCRAIDFLAMAGLSPWSDGFVAYADLSVWVVFRTRPIRIAGNSGPLNGETKWAEIGRPDEFTTVTKKVRRVGAWDPLLAREAVHANGGGTMDGNSVVKAALTMVDHEIPGLAGETSLQLMLDRDGSALDLLVKEKEADMRAPVALVGTGPDTVIDLRESLVAL